MLLSVAQLTPHLNLHTLLRMASTATIKAEIHSHSLTARSVLSASTMRIKLLAATATPRALRVLLRFIVLKTLGVIVLIMVDGEESSFTVLKSIRGIHLSRVEVWLRPQRQKDLSRPDKAHDSSECFTLVVYMKIFASKRASGRCWGKVVDAGFRENMVVDFISAPALAWRGVIRSDCGQHRIYLVKEEVFPLFEAEAAR